MSQLKDRLLNDFKQAMVDKDVIRKNTLQTCRAAILKIEKDRRVELSEDEILKILNSEYKKRQDTVSEVGDTRPDIVEKYQQEMQVIKGYLPEQLSEAEVKQIINEVIESVEAKSPRDMGKVMKALMPKLQGKADGKFINDYVKTALIG